MYAVKSKYKNPDRYIVRLKEQLRLEEHCHKYTREANLRIRGEVIINWASNIFIEQQAVGRNLGSFHAGDKIAITGIVKTVTEDTKSDGSFCSSINYQLLETRRIKE